MFKQIKEIYCKLHLNPMLEDGGEVGRQSVQEVLTELDPEQTKNLVRLVSEPES